MVLRHAVFRRPHPARVLCDIAADKRVFITRRIRGEHQSLFLNRLLQLKCRDPGLANRVQIVRTDLDDLIHPVGSDHDTAINRNRAACIADTATTCCHRKKILVGELEYVDYLSGRFRKDDRLRRKFFFNGVGTIRLDAGWINNDILVANDRSQFVDDLRFRGVGGCPPF